MDVVVRKAIIEDMDKIIKFYLENKEAVIDTDEAIEALAKDNSEQGIKDAIEEDFKKRILNNFVYLGLNREELAGLTYFDSFEKRKSAEIHGICHKKYWGTGLSDIGFMLSVKKGFDELGISEIRTYTPADDSHIISLLKRNGFKKLKEETDKKGRNHIIFFLKKVRN